MPSPTWHGIDEIPLNGEQRFIDSAERVFVIVYPRSSPELSIVEQVVAGQQVLLLIAVASAAMAKPQYGYSPPHTYRPAPTYAPAPSYRPAPSYQAPAKYDYEWGVRDSYSGNDFGHNEDRDGYNTRGSYYVQLPDGRRQKVTYYVNGDSGYVAEVTYEGQAHYPAHHSAPSYHPAPAYTPAPVYG
ncbi:cuticle protein 7-like [Penaeus japonicus]|uniref:cuticle protein 7-like n=1 Tax=Penaeus japonicus TaxID=27405 RepID=UPI001C70F07A|nr:cuticle protein 7-like [Penaeus japonicus]